MPPPDYYKVLGLRPSASLHEIRRAYRDMAKKFHPDKNPGDALAADRFKEVAAAYAIIGNREARIRYDNELYQAGYLRINSKELTAQALLNLCVSLNKSLSGMDPKSISHSSLVSYLNLILTDEHVKKVQLEPDVANRIIAELFQCMSVLPYDYFKKASKSLNVLVCDDPKQSLRLDTLLKRKKYDQRVATWYPVVIAVVSVLLCVFVFEYSRKK